MKRKEKQQDHITTWLQRGYYLMLIAKEFGWWHLIKEKLSEWVSP